MVVVASGVFSYIHQGHLEYLRKAKELGDKLIVLVDGDKKALSNKGYVGLNQDARANIISEFRCVDGVIITDMPVSYWLELIKPDIFAKGGDRTIDNLPQDEIDVCKKYNIEIVCGLGEKINSSSEINKRIKGEKS